MPNIKLCTQMDLSQDLSQQAHDLSVRENSINLDAASVSLTDLSDSLPNGNTLIRSSQNEMAKKLLVAFYTRKMWKAGKILKVRFLDGSKYVQKKVKKYAMEWQKFANISFEFGDFDNAEIRISFSGNGSWSYVGTDALLINMSKPTMNFGWFTDETSEQEFSRTTLHEFGHALGCIHEHQHPGGGIPWDKEAVYRYYERTNGWNKSKVDHNIFTKYKSKELTNSEYDSASIMHYAIPNELTIGDWESSWNTGFSDTDKQFIREAYPFPGDGIFQQVKRVVDNFGVQAGGWLVESHPRFLADITGDGRADIIGFGNKGVYVALNNGDGTFQQVKRVVDNFGVQAGGWLVESHPRFLADITGDGRADIVGFGNAGVYVTLNNGDGTFQQVRKAVDNFGVQAGGWLVESHPRFLADITGDGRADIIGFGNKGVYVALKN